MATLLSRSSGLEIVENWEIVECSWYGRRWYENSEIEEKISDIKTDIENCDEDELEDLQNELEELEECINDKKCVKLNNDYETLTPIEDLNDDNCLIYLEDYDIDTINELEDGYYQLLDGYYYLIGKFDDNGELQLFDDKIVIRDNEDTLIAINIDEFDEYAYDCVWDDKHEEYHPVDTDYGDMSEDDIIEYLKDKEVYRCCCDENNDYEMLVCFTDRILDI